MSKYTAIIGLEIHLELKTLSKMFCGCANDPGQIKANTNVCPVCLAHPGTLPVPNTEAIGLTVLVAEALGCKIAENSKFDRKHYFYPDLPKGYQISQFDRPIGENGQVVLTLIGTKNHRTDAAIGITRVHLEEDTAKLEHGSNQETLVDFNRAGVPLVEIVSNPDIQSGIEAKAYCQELQTIFRYLGVSDANMEKGQMRCEANISVQETGKFEITNGVVKALADYVLNPKIEVKNINSFRAVEKAIDYEIKRQSELIDKGQNWGPETRGWSDEKQETYTQRIKESAADYRYFPEPDIPVFHPKVLAGNRPLPELPAAKRTRLHSEYGFSYADAALLTSDEKTANFAEKVYSELVEWLHSLPETKQATDDIIQTQKNKLSKLAGGWITSKLFGALSERNLSFSDQKISPENFSELIALTFAERVNSTNASKILGEMLDANTDIDPTHIMEDKGYGQIKDETALGAVVDQVIADNPVQVAAFKAGKEPLMQFLKGMVMKATEGSADPATAEKLLREKLK